MGPYRGGQAQYIRIPFADFNALKLPPGKEHESDFILLAGEPTHLLDSCSSSTKTVARHLPYRYVTSHLPSLASPLLIAHSRLAWCRNLRLPTRRDHRRLRRRPRRSDGRVLGDSARCFAGLRRRPRAGAAQRRREDWLHAR